MADKVLLVKFGEIAMRGDNQYIFINRLIQKPRPPSLRHLFLRHFPLHRWGTAIISQHPQHPLHLPAGYPAINAINCTQQHQDQNSDCQHRGCDKLFLKRSCHSFTSRVYPMFRFAFISTLAPRTDRRFLR